MALLLFTLPTWGAETDHVIKWPFQHKLGVDVSVADDAAMNNILNNFKLIRVYRTVNGYDRNGLTALDPTLQSFVKNKNDESEVVLGTYNETTDGLFQQSEYVDGWVKCVKTGFGGDTKSIKAIVIGNEINADAYMRGKYNVLSSIIKNFKSSLQANGMGNIPVTTSFMGLPTGEDPNSPNFTPNFKPSIQAVIDNWSASWNSGVPFIFTNPYPANLSVNPVDALSVFWTQYGGGYEQMLDWVPEQMGVPKLGIYILETGAQNSHDNATTTKMVNAILALGANKKVPMFIFEAYDEPTKESAPCDQRYMGVMTNNGTLSITIPKWYGSGTPGPGPVPPVPPNSKYTVTLDVGKGGTATVGKGKLHYNAGSYTLPTKQPEKLTITTNQGTAIIDLGKAGPQGAGCVVSGSGTNVTVATPGASGGNI